ncbi:MAG: hypothetical protein IKP86_14635, partial [Anaerolineaceae bacterium]|nr:hypothetical protein [Anaerolineaceae bacterium]
TSRVLQIICIAAVRYMLKWLARERKQEEIDKSDFPEIIKQLLRQINKYPVIRNILRNPRIPDINRKSLEDLGIPVIFISLVEQRIPDVNNCLRNVKNSSKQTIQNKSEKIPDIILNSSLVKKLGDQLIAVIANEIIVRGFYFTRHMISEIDRCGDIERVDWNKVIPFDNKTVIRMLSVSTLTFTAADMSIAAIRAAMESDGNAVLFAAKYSANINVVGVGRAIIAVSRDVAMEWKEADLIRERRILVEKISAEQVEAILAYRKQMEAIVEAYLAEDLQSFLTGADELEEGLSVNDSNMVIHGNVTIQRILGRKPQFTDQAEFDELMDSMDALIL